MAIKTENTNAQELENLEWTIGCVPTERGRYQITIENTWLGTVLIVKIDSFDLKVWRNFEKHKNEKYKIVAFRRYDPAPFKSEAYVDAQIKEVEDEIKALENKAAELKGESNG